MKTPYQHGDVEKQQFRLTIKWWVGVRGEVFDISHKVKSAKRERMTNPYHKLESGAKKQKKKLPSKTTPTTGLKRKRRTNGLHQGRKGGKRRVSRLHKEPRRDVHSKRKHKGKWEFRA